MSWPLRRTTLHRSPGRDAVRNALTERALVTERARFVHGIDVELQVSCRTEAAARLKLGIVARELLRRRAYRRLGYVRLADYARERLGISARGVQSAAWVASRLEALPCIADAFDRSELSWAQVRALCALACPDDQQEWLARARRSTVAQLEALAASRRGTAGGDPDSDDGTIDGEPVVRVRIACPSRVRALWRRAVALASQVAGEPLSTWRAAECVAAEAFSGRPAGVGFVERAVLACLRAARRARRAAGVEAKGGAEAKGAARPEVPHVVTTTLTPDAQSRTAQPLSSDPFDLDRRAVAAVQAIRTCEPRIGRLLRIVVDQRVYRARGFGSLAAYARERLGISARKAWALLKVERGTRRGDAFARAYDAGAISWVQALALLPVVDRSNAAAWVVRAQTVTVRRLVDEVGWTLERRDLSPTGATLDPPRLDCVLTSVDGVLTSSAAVARPVQIGARPAADEAVSKFVTATDGARLVDGVRLELSDAEVQFSAPASVAALFREALDVFARPGEPRWSALEHVLAHVVTHWQSTPRHRDPIFARDGWRCAVPGCSSRRNLHDHHLQYRSRGGGNAPRNRVTVCVAHHLHGIHDGVIRAWGTAPRDVHWQLGVRAYASPLVTYVGDRLAAGDG